MLTQSRLTIWGVDYSNFCWFTGAGQAGPPRPWVCLEIFQPDLSSALHSPILCPRNYSWSPVRDFSRSLCITKNWPNWVQVQPGLKTQLDIARFQSLSKATLRSGQSWGVQRCFKVLKTRVRLFKKKSQKTHRLLFLSMIQDGSVGKYLP